MWWLDHRPGIKLIGRLAFVLGAASLTAGCFEPLYGSAPSVQSENVRDKLAAVDVPVIAAPRGQPAERLAVELRNALQYDLNGGAGANAPNYRLKVSVSTTVMSVIVDLTSGRPDAQVDSVVANYQLIEVATNKPVISETTYAHVDYDIPGAAQRFAKQRAQRDAEDRATGVVADNIKNRLASYFVAGT
ncbi:MAG TPA: LPS assembly lipoprotein LptE [Xanthobacteraceae bacterium]|nr:LPS assembly lipoprotein LptE [Xanthobacteraceae bacterium]